MSDNNHDVKSDVGSEVIYDVAVIGAGPAGLTAAIYALRAGAGVIVIEGASIGGQISTAANVENYPGIKSISGMDLAMNYYEQAEALGAKFEYEAVVGAELSGKVKRLKTTGGVIEAYSVIIATGAKCRRLEVAREDELTGMGVSYCAVCDGAFYKGQEVAVVGGGNSAIEDALYLSEYCSRVYIIHRRDTFRAEQAKLDMARRNPVIEFVVNSRVAELEGTETLEGIKLISNDGGERRLSVSGLFIAIGRVPQNDIFAEIDLNRENGYIAAGEGCKTNISGVFSAGDCRDKSVRQLTTACADGSVAALGACEYIKTVKQS